MKCTIGGRNIYNAFDNISSLWNKPNKAYRNKEDVQKKRLFAMLILTHTWILREYMKKRFGNEGRKELYAYNVVPDMLSVQGAISSFETHAITKREKFPENLKKTAFIQFHLLVDDMAHHGEILAKMPPEKFDPNSQGYCYVKGTKLIEQVMALHKSVGEDISFAGASYESHMLIEMAFDIVINQIEDRKRLTTLLCEALSDVMENSMEEFCKNLSWYYSKLSEKDIINAINKSFALCTEERMNAFIGLEGKINLYAGKFGLDKENSMVREKTTSLMLEAMTLSSDYDSFLQRTIAAIDDYGFDDLF